MGEGISAGDYRIGMSRKLRFHTLAACTVLWELICVNIAVAFK